MIRTYTELSRIQTFEGRYDYLRLSGSVGEETFGFDRVFNQKFYSSYEWKRIRNYVITRDLGCDLGIPGHEINEYDKIFIHHMNPISLDDIERRTEILLDPEFLITTIHNTHNAIHYGTKEILVVAPVIRTKNDTIPWRR